MTQTIYKVSNLASDLEGKMHDQSLNKLNGDILDKVDEAARNILLEFDPKETKKYATLELVTGETNVFVCPEDLKGNSIIAVQKTSDSSSYLVKVFLTSPETVKYFTSEQYNISIDYDAGIKTIIFNDLEVLNTGVSYVISYYSVNLFKDSETDALKDKPTSLDDIILLEKDTLNVLLYELAELVAQEMQGEDSSFDLKYWQIKKKNVWDQYGRRYPSEAKPKQQKYYRPFKRD